MNIRDFDGTKDLQRIVTLFQQCFGEAPWFERFDPKKLSEWFTELASVSNTIFLVLEVESRVVGCAIAYPLKSKPDVHSLCTQEDANALYMAELFVEPAYRNRGFGRALTRERFKIGWQQGFRRAVVRTSVVQGIIRELYCDRFGFEVTCTQDVISTKWIDGIEQEVPDTRVIMVGDIPDLRSHARSA